MKTHLYPTFYLPKHMNKTTKTQGIFIRLFLLVCFGLGSGIQALEATPFPAKTAGDPLVWLKFEDNLINSGTGEVDAVNVGTAQYTDGPGSDRAYDFRVSGNNELSLPGYTGINGAGARTVALWVKTEMDGSIGSLVHWGAGGTNSRASFRVMGDGVIRFEWQGGGRDSDTKVNDGQWHHVAYTYNGSQLKIFVNGVEENSVNHTLNTGNAGETDVEIGSQLNANRFTGAMTDVRIYDRALSVEEIGLLMALVETYTVTFEVEDIDGMPIGDAIITLGGVTNPAGNYVFEDVQAGSQTYKVEHPAYQDVEAGLLVTENMTLPVVMLEEGAAYPVIWLEFNNNLNNSGSEELTASTDGTPQYADGPGAKNAYVFDGDNHLSLPGYNGIAGANPRTVALWINTSATTRQSLAHWGTAANFTRNTFAVQNNGLLRLEWAGGGLNSTQSVNDGEWRHVAYTYDGSRVQLYIDGQPKTGQDIALSTAGSEVQLGARGAGEPFSGSMAGLRIYDVALTQEQIGELFDKGEEGPVVLIPENFLRTSGDGQVSIDPQQDEYQPGDQVVLTATPEGTHSFLRWRGTFKELLLPAKSTSSSVNNPIMVELQEDTDIVAVFGDPAALPLAPLAMLIALGLMLFGVYLRFGR
jgi:hypothetical protein